MFPIATLLVCFVQLKLLNKTGHQFRPHYVRRPTDKVGGHMYVWHKRGGKTQHWGHLPLPHPPQLVTRVRHSIIN